jgi:RNA polymerase sigma factor (sigma-70 family)
VGTRAPWILRHEVPGESDEHLTERAREGDQAAFGELYRRHRKAAESTAWCLLRSKVDADDVVADAFAGVLSALRNGRGPRDNFRRYLLACVRNGCRSRRSRYVPVQEPSIERRAPVLEEPERYVEADTVARAFAALTPRWQYTLWLTAVEQRPPQEVSERMHLSPSATAALAHRARQAFATAYLAEHVSTVRNRVCAKHAPQLAAYVRGALTGPAEATIDHHLVMCRDCAAAAAELRDVNASLRSLSLPPQLVAAGAVAASAATVTAAAATTAAVPGLWAGLSGASALVKGLIAVLLVAPAISAEHPGARPAGSVAGHRFAAARPAPVAPAASPSAASASAATPVDVFVRSVQPVAADREPTEVDAPDPVAAHPSGGADDREASPNVDRVVDEVVAPVAGVDVEPDTAGLPERDHGLEPVVAGLDEALAAMGLGTTGETIRVLQSMVPLLDGPLADVVVTDLLEVAASEDGAPVALTNLFTGLQGTDGSAPVVPTPPAPAEAPIAAPTAPAPPTTLLAAVPVALPVTLPDVPTLPVGPDLQPPAVVLPSIAIPATIELPSVAIIDGPTIALPALGLADISIPPLIVIDAPQ